MSRLPRLARIKGSRNTVATRLCCQTLRILLLLGRVRGGFCFGRAQFRELRAGPDEEAGGGIEFLHFFIRQGQECRRDGFQPIRRN